jgi:hypothetical protein
VNGADDDRSLWEVAFKCCVDCNRVFSMKLLDKVVGIDMGQGFPTVMCLGKALPPNQVLQLVAPSPCT